MVGRPTFWRVALIGQAPYGDRRALYAPLAADLGIAAEQLVVAGGPCACARCGNVSIVS